MCLLWQRLLFLNRRDEKTPKPKQTLCDAPLSFVHIFGDGLSLLALTTRKDEMVVVAVASPGTRRHIEHFHKLPVGHISRCEAKIIADRR